MDSFPQRYRVTASGDPLDDVQLAAERLTAMRSASPAEFDGPGDLWSPETLLVGALADCFVLTFRAIAAASKLPWSGLQCEVTGTLDRIERVTQFTQFDIVAHLTITSADDAARARQMLDKAERNCLISSSLKGPVTLTATVRDENAVLVA